MPAEVLTAVVSQNANVRTGPGTDHPIAYWLTAGAEVTVTGRNAEGTWLQIEHDDRPGWISATLTEIAADAPPVEPAPEPVAAEPTVAPDPDPTVAVEPEPTPATVEPTPEPTPEPEPEAAAPARVVVTVTGTVVNLRVGPGTEHAQADQARAGDQLDATGRNADGSWLQVADPRDPAGRVWIYGPLTDIDNAALQTLAVVQPTPEPAAQEPEPTVEPAAQPIVPANCTQLHTVNPNETQLVQITNWFGLDLQTVANLNGIDAAAPLTAGTQICLSVDAESTPPAASAATSPAAQPPPAAPAGPVAGTGICLSRNGNPHPCLDIPDRPELAVRSVDGPATYFPPDSYDRSEHPALAYDFQLVLEDRSAMWNWRMRDFEGCYDALRIHMGEIPEAVGLTRLEVHLSDPIFGKEYPEMDELGSEQIRGMRFHKEPMVPLPRGHVDESWVALRCYEERGRSADHVVCSVFPKKGNSGSINFEAALNLALAATAGSMSRRGIEFGLGFRLCALAVMLRCPTVAGRDGRGGMSSRRASETYSTDRWGKQGDCQGRARIRQESVSAGASCVQLRAIASKWVWA